MSNLSEKHAQPPWGHVALMSKRSGEGILQALVSGLQQKPPTLNYEQEGDQEETTTERKGVLQV